MISYLVQNNGLTKDECSTKIKDIIRMLKEYAEILTNEYGIEFNPSFNLMSFTKVSTSLELPSTKSICELFFKLNSKIGEETNGNKFRILLSYYIAEAYAFSFTQTEIFQEDKGKFDTYFRDSLFQTTKSGFLFSDLEKYATRVLSISDVYKIFERC